MRRRHSRPQSGRERLFRVWRHVGCVAATEMDDPAIRSAAQTAASDKIGVASPRGDLGPTITLPPGGRNGLGLRPAYIAPNGRDLRLDLLRGFLVAAMVINHLPGDSPLYLLTGGNRFFTSAAEGFLLISGLMAGLVYRRAIQRSGLAAGLLKVLRRAATLYALTVTATLLFTVFSEAAGLSWAMNVDLSNPMAFVVSVLTLHQTYYLTDVLVLYTILFLAAPAAFILLERGKTWLLLAGSGLIYALYQLAPNAFALPWPIEGNHLFEVAAWQVLFVAGLALGYHQSRLPALGHSATRTALLAAGIAMAGLVILFALLTLAAGQPHDPGLADPGLQRARLWLEEYAFSKVDLRPGRLIAAVIVFGLFFLLMTRFWSGIRRAAGWVLIPLGQNALYAFTAHIVLVGLAGLVLPEARPTGAGALWLSAAIQLAGVGLVLVLVKRRILMPTRATHRYWHASPAIASLAIVTLLGHMSFSARPLEHAAAMAVAIADDPAPRRYGTPVPRARAVQAEVVATPEASPAPAASSYVTVFTGTDRLLSDYLPVMDGSAHERTLFSPALGRSMPYYIYLPPGYEESGKRYPVLYMLHGLGGHREEWITYGFIGMIDQQIRFGNVAPFIVVLPQGDKGYWVDNANGGPRWGEYLVRDIVGNVDANYRTLQSPASRGIGGLSAGGFAALSQAFTRPDLFGVVGAHSPSLRGDDGEIALLGQGDEFDARDPIFLAGQSAQLDSLRIWIDIGSGDEIWLPGARLLRETLAKRDAPVEWWEFPGAHDFDYWNGHIVEYVQFYGGALKSE